MTKNEVIELVKSGRLRGFLPPEMAQYEVNETLDDEEILGYSVSIYDADKHELEKGTEYCINKQIDKVRNLRINELKEMGEIQPDIKPDNDNPKL